MVEPPLNQLSLESQTLKPKQTRAPYSRLTRAGSMHLFGVGGLGFQGSAPAPTLDADASLL